MLFFIVKILLFNRWGRWRDILSHGKFKKMLVEKDVETISRALVRFIKKKKKKSKVA